MKAIGLVVIAGGVADVFTPTHVDVRVVDIDNIKAGDPPVELPSDIGFEELVARAEVGNYVKFSRQAKLDRLLAAMENHGNSEGTETQLGDAVEFLALAIDLMDDASAGEFFRHDSVKAFEEREL